MGRRAEAEGDGVNGKDMGMKRTLAIWVALLAVGAVAWAGPVMVDDFPLAKDIKPPKGATRNAAAFLLDEDLFAGTDHGYTNMRVFDDQDREVPFVARRKLHRKVAVDEFLLSMRTTKFGLLPENRAEIVLRREDDRQELLPSLIEVQTRQRDYEKQVTVSGSHDGVTWKRLASDEPIFDYSKYINFRKNRVAIQRGKYSHYRIEIENVAESKREPLRQVVREMGSSGEVRLEKIAIRRQDLKIDKINVLAEREREVGIRPTEAEYAAECLRVVEDAEKRETRVLFRVKRVPVISLVLDARTPNFSRLVRVEGSDDEEGNGKWQGVITHTIRAVDVGSYREVLATIPFRQPRRHTWYRLTIRNLDSPPLDIAGVRVNGEVWETLFFRALERKYRVLYGAAAMEPPRYDIAASVERTREEDVDIYSLGPEQQTAASEVKRRWLSGRAVMVGVVVLAAAVLFWLIARTLKGAEAAGREEE